MILKFHGKASKKKCYKSVLQGNSLTVQWLGLRASTAGGTGSIPDWGGDKIAQAAQCRRKKKKKKKTTESEKGPLGDDNFEKTLPNLGKYC